MCFTFQALKDECCVTPAGSTPPPHCEFCPNFLLQANTERFLQCVSIQAHARGLFIDDSVDNEICSILKNAEDRCCPPFEEEVDATYDETLCGILGLANCVPVCTG